MGEIVHFNANDPQWMKEADILSELGLTVGIITHPNLQGVADRLVFEAEPGVPISPHAFARAEAIRRLFDSDAAVREEMKSYYWAMGGVVRAA